MDDKTRQRLENYRKSEQKCDFEINMLQDLWGNKLNLSWLDIIMFAWTWGRKGCASRRMKEMFIENVSEKYLEKLKS
jgi:hypothetical protein